jgi:NAD-dependent SIR2 family protein deacetylase
MKKYKCNRCQQTRNADEFYNCQRSKSGKRLWACKVCQAQPKPVKIGTIQPLSPEQVNAFSAWVKKALQIIVK